MKTSSATTCLIPNTTPSQAAADTSPAVTVTDDVGLVPVKDGFIQHDYVILPDATMAQLQKDTTLPRLMGIQARANSKNTSGGWTNDILTAQNAYLEIAPTSFGGNFIGQTGSAIGVQSEADAIAAQANLKKLFSPTESDKFFLNVKDNAQVGDTTEHFPAHMRDLEQWWPDHDKETNGSPFSGNWVGVWATDERKPKNGAVEDIHRTLAKTFHPEDLVTRITEQHNTMGAEDLANYAKMLACGGFQVQFIGATADAETPKLSTLQAWIKDQGAKGAQLEMVAHPSDPAGMVVYSKLSEDSTRQGYDSNTLALRKAVSTPIDLAFGTADSGVLHIQAPEGATTATIWLERPPPAAPQV